MDSIKKYEMTMNLLRKHQRQMTDEVFMQFQENAFAFGQEAGKSFLEILDEIQELLLADVIPAVKSGIDSDCAGEVTSTPYTFKNSDTTNNTFSFLYTPNKAEIQIVGFYGVLTTRSFDRERVHARRNYCIMPR